MPKYPDRSPKNSSTAQLIVLIVFGALFLGTYLILERFVLKSMPGGVTALAFFALYLALSALAFLFFRLKQFKQHGEQVLFESLNTKMHNMFKYVVKLPYAIVDETGRVRAVNNALQELIGARDPFFRGSLSDICSGAAAAEKILGEHAREEQHTPADAAQDAKKGTDAEEDGVQVRIKGGYYIARAHRLNVEGETNFLVTFTDVTKLTQLKNKMERDMPAVAYVDIDNLEELAQYTHANYRDIARRVDDLLLQWVADLNGFMLEYERNRYLVLFSQEKLKLCEKDKFSSLLDGVRNIRLGEYGIPVTLSAGISLSDASMEERAKDAESALNLALQRGGDQVAVRREGGIEYYGGQIRTLARRTKVQSRMVANFLLPKISEADNLLVMGHRKPDFDSIGSCLGVAQLGLFAGVPTKIIIDTDNSNFRIATKRLTASRTYADLFISGHQGLGLIRPGTLLVITDANNFQIIEAPDVAASVKQISGKIAIIDHHRQTGEYDFEPIINYIEPGASSASELVTEMLEQCEVTNVTETGALVSDEVASVMLSGIMLDTAGFTRNTGTRTLDAARFLFSKGANAEYVHGFFNEDYADYVCERSFSGCTLLQNDTVGMTWSHGTGRGSDDRVAAAKEAEKLLGVKGVCAAFALVETEDAVHISGRSDGTVNVQLILEKLGGGGRFDSAGAALNDKMLARAKEDLAAAINEYFNDQESAKRAD